MSYVLKLILGLLFCLVFLPTLLCIAWDELMTGIEKRFEKKMNDLCVFFYENLYPPEEE